MTAPPQPLPSPANTQPIQVPAQPNEPNAPLLAAPADPPSVDSVLSAVEYRENVDLSTAERPPTVPCTPNDHDNAEVLHEKSAVAQAAAVASPQGTTPPCPATKFNWTATKIEETTTAWESFSPFLEHHGVWLYGTERWKRRTFPPSVPPLDPFRPTENEDFVHRQERIYPRTQFYEPPNPFCILAIDKLDRELYIKAVSKTSTEWQILEYLSSPELRSKSTNHTIPVMSVLHHHDNETVFLVQATWGYLWCDSPDFESMKERYTVVYQLLEGLAFMHEHGVSHGDLHHGNIVCNHHDRRLTKYAENYTPFHRDFDYRVAYIDFELSTHFLSDDSHQVPCDSLGPPDPFGSPEQAEGRKKEGATFDSFPADVYSLGQVLIMEASEVQLVLPPQYDALLSEMTAKDPRDRPSAAEGLKRVQEMLAAVS